MLGFIGVAFIQGSIGYIRSRSHSVVHSVSESLPEVSGENPSEQQDEASSHSKQTGVGSYPHFLVSFADDPRRANFLRRALPLPSAPLTRPLGGSSSHGTHEKFVQPVKCIERAGEAEQLEGGACRAGSHPRRALSSRHGRGRAPRRFVAVGHNSVVDTTTTPSSIEAAPEAKAEGDGAPGTTSILPLLLGGGGERTPSYPDTQDAVATASAAVLTMAETNPFELLCSLRANEPPLYSIQIHPGISAMASMIAYGCDSPGIEPHELEGFFVL